MAIKMRQFAIFNKDGFTYEWIPQKRDVTVLGTEAADSDIVSIASTGTNITLSNVSSPGWVAMKNPGPTAVDIGYDDGGTLRDLIRLETNDFCMFRLVPGKTLRGSTASGTQTIQYMIFEA